MNHMSFKKKKKQERVSKVDNRDQGGKAEELEEDRGENNQEEGKMRGPPEEPTKSLKDCRRALTQRLQLDTQRQRAEAESRWKSQKKIREEVEKNVKERNESTARITDFATTDCLYFRPWGGNEQKAPEEFEMFWGTGACFDRRYGTLKGHKAPTSKSPYEFFSCLQASMEKVKVKWEKRVQQKEKAEERERIKAEKAKEREKMKAQNKKKPSGKKRNLDEDDDDESETGEKKKKNNTKTKKEQQETKRRKDAKTPRVNFDLRGCACVETDRQKANLLDRTPNSNVISLLEQGFPNVKISEFEDLINEDDSLVFLCKRQGQGHAGAAIAAAAAGALDEGPRRPLAPPPLPSLASVAIAHPIPLETSAFHRSSFEKKILLATRAAQAAQKRTERAQGPGRRGEKKEKGAWPGPSALDTLERYHDVDPPGDPDPDTDPTALYVTFLTTCPEERGRGYGRRLFERIEKEARLKGYVAVFTQASLYDEEEEEGEDEAEESDGESKERKGEEAVKPGSKDCRRKGNGGKGQQGKEKEIKTEEEREEKSPISQWERLNRSALGFWEKMGVRMCSWGVFQKLAGTQSGIRCMRGDAVPALKSLTPEGVFPGYRFVEGEPVLVAFGRGYLPATVVEVRQWAVAIEEFEFEGKARGRREKSQPAGGGAWALKVRVVETEEDVSESGRHESEGQTLLVGEDDVVPFHPDIPDAPQALRLGLAPLFAFARRSFRPISSSERSGKVRRMHHDAEEAHHMHQQKEKEKEKGEEEGEGNRSETHDPPAAAAAAAQPPPKNPKGRRGKKTDAPVRVKKEEAEEGGRNKDNKPLSQLSLNAQTGREVSNRGEKREEWRPKENGNGGEKKVLPLSEQLEEICRASREKPQQGQQQSRRDRRDRDRPPLQRVQVKVKEEEEEPENEKGDSLKVQEGDKTAAGILHHPGRDPKRPPAAKRPRQQKPTADVSSSPTSHIQKKKKKTPPDAAASSRAEADGPSLQNPHPGSPTRPLPGKKRGARRQTDTLPLPPVKFESPSPPRAANQTRVPLAVDSPREAPEVPVSTQLASVPLRRPKGRPPKKPSPPAPRHHVGIKKEEGEEDSQDRENRPSLNAQTGACAALPAGSMGLLGKKRGEWRPKNKETGNVNGKKALPLSEQLEEICRVSREKPKQDEPQAREGRRERGSPLSVSQSARMEVRVKEEEIGERDGRVRGVSWDRLKSEWISSISVAGRNVNVKFAVSKYGDTESLRRATECREEMERTKKGGRCDIEAMRRELRLKFCQQEVPEGGMSMSGQRGEVRGHPRGQRDALRALPPVKLEETSKQEKGGEDSNDADDSGGKEDVPDGSSDEIVKDPGAGGGVVVRTRGGPEGGQIPRRNGRDGRVKREQGKEKDKKKNSNSDGVPVSVLHPVVELTPQQIVAFSWTSQGMHRRCKFSAEKFGGTVGMRARLASETAWAYHDWGLLNLLNTQMPPEGWCLSGRMLQSVSSASASAEGEQREKAAEDLGGWGSVLQVREWLKRTLGCVGEERLKGGLRVRNPVQLPRLLLPSDLDRLSRGEEPQGTEALRELLHTV
uniref:Uncharacterized protein n=1 Tax=Chromera velia CCMP2878 TaxID=1169474 RepID=A0A0G4I4W9_9ALVE|eukprot:Cvel_1829.t1-p1 / transcript=Cvel_1829.t1 / gene=Cvel_1829 / organism=Chromera_velia_CCMP2878 / gene_product=hypothetical protein / transcript_product=hypothetical protein / location=Cvel_scaffold67:109804-119858(-) / protein_length=1556 / sequence_SO=supercontig / SO=protein_coding / is_pseudo=false